MSTALFWGFICYLLTRDSYSGSREIHQYFLKVAEDYDLLKFCRVNHLVTGCFWQEESQTWRVRVQKVDKPDEVFEDECNVLLNATGVLK